MKEKRKWLEILIVSVSMGITSGLVTFFVISKLYGSKEEIMGSIPIISIILAIAVFTIMFFTCLRPTVKTKKPIKKLIEDIESLPHSYQGLTILEIKKRGNESFIYLRNQKDWSSIDDEIAMINMSKTISKKIIKGIRILTKRKELDPDLFLLPLSKIAEKLKKKI